LDNFSHFKNHRKEIGRNSHAGIVSYVGNKILRKFNQLFQHNRIEEINKIFEVICRQIIHNIHGTFGDFPKL
jgi:hypothetical protein